jgi:hypothetical protein
VAEAPAACALPGVAALVPAGIGDAVVDRGAAIAAVAFIEVAFIEVADAGLALSMLLEPLTEVAKGALALCAIAAGTMAADVKTIVASEAIKTLFIIESPAVSACLHAYCGASWVSK